ncbi:phage protein Gp27 family protein [Methylococcus capsulatus]|uniref:phage protein Gp27 family protein n=1 Tax=Methylococcus capsulatus TaxID=414 RepID=UPI002FDAE717
MPRPSIFNKLPERIRSELDARIIASSFTDFEGHSRWLTECGYPAGTSVIHRYSQRLRGRQAVKQATLSPSAQVEAVKRALLAGEPVDQVTAVERGWGFRLASIIYRLRRQGWPILDERDHGNGLARYWLEPGWSPPIPADTKKP